MIALREQTPEDHAQGVASSKAAYVLDGDLVYVSSTRRQAHVVRRWGYYTLVIYRGIFKGFERTMPQAKFFTAAHKTGRTVEQEIQRR